MKKLAIILMILLLSLLPVVTAGAEETQKTVDGSGDRWEQESTNTASLATMTWNSEADTLNFSGTGYKDRIGMKFGFRCKIAFDTEDLSVTLQFPETFNALFSEESGNNMHFVVALVNTWSRWWNTDSNDVKSAAFVIRPQAQDKVSVEIAGRWAVSGTGYGDISSAVKTEFTLDATRSMKFGIKKEGELYSAYVNDVKFADFNKELKDGKTMSDYIEDFNEGKGYLQFGATLEKDTENIELSYTITQMGGALDAFQQPIVGPGDNDDENETPPVTQQAGADSSRFNWNYVILYSISGCAGVAALVCFVLARFRRS